MFRNFDLQKQKPKAMRLEVAGSDQVEVPAGIVRYFPCGVDVGGRRSGAVDGVGVEGTMAGGEVIDGDAGTRRRKLEAELT